MMRVIAMILLSLLPGLLPAKVFTYDRIMVDGVTISSECTGVLNGSKVWDFSNAEVLDHGRWRYRLLPDSTLVEITDRMRYMYNLRSDSICWIGYENRSTSMRGAIAVPILRLPLSAGDSIKSCYSFSGKYLNSLRLVESGTIVTRIDSEGIVILPSADTIRSAVRVTEQREFTIKCEHEIDSITPTQRVTITRWLNAIDMTPIAESRQTDIYEYDQLMESQRVSYLLTPSANATQEAKQLDNTPELMVQTQSNGGKVISNVTATRSGNVVTVDIEVSQMSEATLHLTDLSGRVHNATTITLTPEMAPINIDAGTSPVGEYIVVLTISGEQPLRILARQR